MARESVRRSRWHSRYADLFERADAADAADAGGDEAPGALRAIRAEGRRRAAELVALRSRLGAAEADNARLRADLGDVRLQLAALVDQLLPGGLPPSSAFAVAPAAPPAAPPRPRKPPRGRSATKRPKRGDATVGNCTERVMPHEASLVVYHETLPLRSSPTLSARSRRVLRKGAWIDAGERHGPWSLCRCRRRRQ